LSLMVDVPEGEAFELQYSSHLQNGGDWVTLQQMIGSAHWQRIEVELQGPGCFVRLIPVPSTDR